MLQQVCHEQFEDPDKRRKQLMQTLDDIPQKMKTEKASKNFIDLLKKMLVKNPKKR